MQGAERSRLKTKERKLNKGSYGERKEWALAGFLNWGKPKIEDLFP